MPLPRSTGDLVKRHSWDRGCVLGHPGGQGAGAVSWDILGVRDGNGMGIRERGGGRRVVWGVSRGALGCAGTNWDALGCVVAMQGEGLALAELVVPTRGVSRMATSSKSICRETRRPRWALDGPGASERCGDTTAPQIPSGDALQSQHPTHLPQIILGSFQQRLGKESKGLVRMGPCGAVGDTGAGSRVRAMGWELRELQGDLFVVLRWGRPKDTELGSVDGPRDWAGGEERTW